MPKRPWKYSVDGPPEEFDWPELEEELDAAEMPPVTDAPPPPKSLEQYNRTISTARTLLLTDRGWLAPALNNIRNVVIPADRWPEGVSPTAFCNENGRVGWHTDFLEELSPKEVAGILLHELGHLIREHFYRRGNRDPYVWNIAGDAAINGEILKVNQEMKDNNEPVNVLLPDKGIRGSELGVDDLDDFASGWTTEQIYAALRQKIKDTPKPPTPPTQPDPNAPAIIQAAQDFMTAWKHGHVNRGVSLCLPEPEMPLLVEQWFALVRVHQFQLAAKPVYLPDVVAVPLADFQYRLRPLNMLRVMLRQMREEANQNAPAEQQKIEQIIQEWENDRSTIAQQITDEFEGAFPPGHVYLVTLIDHNGTWPIVPTVDPGTTSGPGKDRLLPSLPITSIEPPKGGGGGGGGGGSFPLPSEINEGDDSGEEGGEEGNGDGDGGTDGPGGSPGKGKGKGKSKGKGSREQGGGPFGDKPWEDNSSSSGGPKHPAEEAADEIDKENGIDPTQAPEKPWPVVTEEVRDRQREWEEAKRRESAPPGYGMGEGDRTLDPEYARMAQGLNNAIRRIFSTHGVLGPGRGVTTFRRPSRRPQPRGLIMPGQRARTADVAVVMDISGSMPDVLVEEGLGQVMAVARSTGSRPWVIPTAGEATTPFRLTNVPDAIRRLQLTGGTDMSVGMHVADRLKPKPDLTIVFTDGDTPWPSQPTNTPTVVILPAYHQPYQEPPDWTEVLRIDVPEKYRGSTY